MLISSLYFSHPPCTSSGRKRYLRLRNWFRIPLLWFHVVWPLERIDLHLLSFLIETYTDGCQEKLTLGDRMIDAMAKRKTMLKTPRPAIYQLTVKREALTWLRTPDRRETVGLICCHEYQSCSCSRPFSDYCSRIWFTLSFFKVHGVLVW